MKRILIFSVAYHPFVAGAEIAVKEITDRTSGIIFDMVTVNLDGKQKPFERIGNVNIYRIGKNTLGKFLFPIYGYRRARQLHEEHRYDAIWSIMASQASIAAAFFKKAKPEVPLILTIQEGDEESYLKRYVGGNTFLYKLFIRPFHTLVFKRANLITAISTYLKDRARKINPRVPIEIITNGVDLKLFTQHFSESDKAEMRRELGFTLQDRLLITTSRLVEKNAVEDIISSLIVLPQEVKLLILGIGPLANTLLKQAHDMGVEERVFFLGLKPYAELPKYLAAADIFIRPSVSEGMGNSFIEAMAAGVPVIATAVGGIPDFLKDPSTDSHPTGLFCNVHDPRNIAEKISLLLENRDLRHKIITNARALAIEKYDWSRIAQEMHNKVFSKI
jgi:glycosyltransferase involved in cell wall biosynthesis